MLDTRQTVFDRNDDILREYNTSDGLISKYAFGCVIGSDSVLYVANDTGLLVFSGGEFQRYTDISDQEHFDVEIDTEGRIWIMTRSGLYYYDPDLETIQGWEYYEMGVHIQFLDFSNELIQIQAFEFDPLRDCLWLGGETGLLKFSVMQTPDPQLDSILIYPNPVIGVSVVRIKNLPEDAEVQIHAITGRLLAEDLVPDPVFGEVVWYIPDDVPSGLYFALIKTADNRKVCKFAIVR
jgi:ligand-binding sensor domain-containing protein